MKRILLALGLCAAVAPASASNMGFKLDRHKGFSSLTHQTVGINFSNGWVATIVVSKAEYPKQLVSDLLANTGCSFKPGKGSVDSCLMSGDSTLTCTRYLAACPFVQPVVQSNMGFKLDRAVQILTSRSSAETRIIEVWNGVYNPTSSQEYVRLLSADGNTEIHATVDWAGKDDAMLTFGEPQPPRVRDIPIVIDICKRISRKSCAMILRGDCPCTTRQIPLDPTLPLWEFPRAISSFP